MRQNLEDFRDQCGEVNCTALAESAAHGLDLFEGDDLPEKVFELASEADDLGPL